MDLELNGRVAVVTGASRGIGAAICTELAREGMDICLVARDADAMRSVAASLGNSVQTHVHTADLRDPDSARAAIQAAIGTFGRIDLLVNNAGATKRADFFQLTDDDFLDGFALKYHGYVRMTREAWPHLRQTRGSIVNIVGVGARSGSAEFAIGGSVNAAILNFTKAMADIGIEQGVRVNAINPGLIATDRFIRNVERTMRERSLDRDAAERFLLSNTKTERVGRPDEIGTMTAFLASNKADFVQGSLIDVDGGWNRAL